MILGFFSLLWILHRFLRFRIGSLFACVAVERDLIVNDGEITRRRWLCKSTIPCDAEHV